MTDPEWLRQLCFRAGLTPAQLQRRYFRLTHDPASVTAWMEQRWDDEPTLDQFTVVLSILQSSPPLADEDVFREWVNRMQSGALT